MSVYAADIVGIHCTYPRRNVQVELTRVAGYILSEIVYWSADIGLVAHPGTNQVRHRVTSSIEHHT